MKQNKEYSICGTDPFTEAAKGGKRRQLPESNCDKGQQVRCRLWPLFAALFNRIFSSTNSLGDGVYPKFSFSHRSLFRLFQVRLNVEIGRLGERFG